MSLSSIPIDSNFFQTLPVSPLKIIPSSLDLWSMALTSILKLLPPQRQMVIRMRTTFAKLFKLVSTKRVFLFFLDYYKSHFPQDSCPAYTYFAVSAAIPHEDNMGPCYSCFLYANATRQDLNYQLIPLKHNCEKYALCQSLWPYELQVGVVVFLFFLKQ